MGASKVSPAAMYVDRRTRWEDGEYDGPDTPDLGSFLQNVVGLTVMTCQTSKKEK